MFDIPFDSVEILKVGTQSNECAQTQPADLLSCIMYISLRLGQTDFSGAECHFTKFYIHKLCEI